MKYFEIPLSLFLLLLVAHLASGEDADGTTSRLSQCGGDISSDADSLSYPPPGEALFPGETCVWTIHLENRTNFRFAIANLNIASNYTDCRDGALRFYSLTNLSPLEGSTYCDIRPPPPTIFLPNSVVVLILHIGKDNASPGAGFSLSWTATNSDPVGTKHLTSFTTANQGVMKYPVAGNYEQNLVATWLIKTTSPQATTSSDFSLNSLSLGSCSNPEGPCVCDALILYVIAEEGGTLNETERFCGGSPSTAFLSNIGSRWILAFFTDWQTQVGETGFEVVYYPTSDSPTTPGPTTVTTTTTQGPITETPCGSILSETVTGRISYKAGQLYAPNERCVWTIRIPNAVGISFTLLQSGLAGSDPDDGLSVSTFTRADPPLQQTAFMRDEGLLVTLRGSLAIVTFVTDTALEGLGFVLEYRATDFFAGNITALSKDFISSTPLGYLEHPEGLSYENNELSTFVITTPGFSVDTQPRLNVTWVSRGLESSCYDYVILYKFYSDPNEFGGWSQYDLYCATSPKLTSHNDILLFVFKSDFTGIGNGFSLEWVTA